MLKQKRVLVYGAGGGQGGAVARSLKEAGYRIRVLARSESTAAAIANDDVEVFRGELEDFESLYQASLGVDAVAMNLPIVFDLELMKRHAGNIVEAAKQAGVERLVYNSSICAPDRPIGYDFFDRGIRPVIESVQSSGLSNIVLRPPLYVDNVRADWTMPLMESDDVLSYAIDAHNTLPWLSFRNLGQYVAKAVERPDLNGEVFDIAWPNRFRGQAIAESISRALGRTIRYEACAPRELAERVAAAWGAAAADHVESLYALINADEGALTNRDYQRAFRVLRPELETLEDWARRCFGALAKAAS